MAYGGKLKVWHKRIDQLAWQLAVRPDPQRRHTAAAMDLAQQAVALAPRDPTVWMTLGAAHYRAGRFQAALESLTKSLELQPPGKSGAFLSEAHGRGPPVVRPCHRTERQGRTGSEWLTLLRREAADVVGVTQ